MKFYSKESLLLMKKLLTFLLALTLLFSLFACNSTGEEDGQENGDSRLDPSVVLSDWKSR